MKNQVIQIYLLVCQIYDNQSSLKYQRRSNFKPVFTDQEIITIYLFGQLNGKFNSGTNLAARRQCPRFDGGARTCGRITCGHQLVCR
ncbi:MAG TPA: hypothetical protein VK308_15450 [Pyrinomonadaceae bacterium]|nr:hypothetical protein [Pyrinomonadaceae bacterium]